MRAPRVLATFIACLVAACASAEPCGPIVRKLERPAASARPEADPATPAGVPPKIQGRWQAYDFGLPFKTYEIHVEGTSFRADGGPDEWYEGQLAVRPDSDPAQIDFKIEDCRCDFKGTTSKGIYYWHEDGSLVIAAPRPDSPRPEAFLHSTGQLMQLRRIEGE